jgi:hypothetical protein
LKQKENKRNGDERMTEERRREARMEGIMDKCENPQSMGKEVNCSR